MGKSDVAERLLVLSTLGLIHAKRSLILLDEGDWQALRIVVVKRQVLIQLVWLIWVRQLAELI